MPVSLPEGWSIIPDAEYALLCLLPTFSKRGDDVLYRNECGTDYFVIRQSAYDRMCQLTAEVDSECLTLDEPSPIELPELPVPTPPPAPNIPQADLDQLAKLGLDKPPAIVGECNRPRDGGNIVGSGMIDIGAIFGH
jgi:hypothetical protein